MTDNQIPAVTRPSDLATGPATDLATDPDSLDVSVVTDISPRSTQRAALKAKHAQSLTRLMGTRSDLRGVHALADHLDDAVRWTA